jgi:hypothetical protein
VSRLPGGRRRLAARVPSPARAGHRRQRTLRRLAGWLVHLTPSLWIAGGDLLRRPEQIAAFDRLHALGYAASLLGALLFWAGLLHVACDRRPLLRGVAGALFVGLFTVSTAVQTASYDLFHTYFNLDSAYHVDSIPWIVLGTLPLRALSLLHAVAALAVAVGLLVLARRVVRPRRIPRRARALLLVPAAGLLFACRIPVSYVGQQSTTPELVYFHGVSRVFQDRLRSGLGPGGLLVRVQRRTPPSLPALRPAPARPRNVLFVLQEALRADMTCIAADEACTEANQETNDLFPHRLPLRGMRSVGSSTIVAFAAIFSGLDPTDTRERLHAAPLTWELAHAAGYHAAFWTNQHPMFGNYRLYFQDLPLTMGCSGAEIDPLADILAGPDDDLLSERVIADWDRLPEPFFAVVQYSNIHFPRVFDPERAPFQPTDPFEKEEPYRNHYKNVAYLSDVAVARLLRHVRGSAASPRTVIVFSADHGEALAEHDNENFHSSTVYDEELRIPAWIDAPPGTLAPAEVQSLESRRDEPIFQLDLAPTFLDLLGVWDAPELAAFRAAMPGRPLTRPERPVGPVPLTNVSWVWEYWKPNWGMMDWPLKVLAGPEDSAYHCFDLARDPWEIRDLGEAACGPLAEAARAHFKLMPAEMDRHLRAAPRWRR